MNYGLLVIYLVMALCFGMELVQHGEQKKPDTHNIFWVLASIAFWLVLIWWALGWQFV